jgi:hypothetical protein
LDHGQVNFNGAILNNQFAFEIICYTKETAAFIEKDAISCYDWMVNLLHILSLLKETRCQPSQQKGP